MNAFEKNRDLIERFCPGATVWGNERLRPIFPELVDKIVSDIYGFAYRRTGLTIKTRHLISLGVISTMDDCENQLKFQLRSALHLGIAPDEVREVFIQVAVFAGNARAINAALVLKSVLEEMSASEMKDQPCA